jgi:hypothetical protein
MRAPTMGRTEYVGAALVLYGESGMVEYATAGWDAAPALAAHDDVVRVRRLVSPEKMSRAARRIAA